MQETIKQTKDFSLFKIVDCNRELVEAHVRKLIESISSNNLLSIHPILVDKEGNIIDGQHRYEAAKRLQVPIFYRNVDLSYEDIPSLQVAKTWNYDDFLRHYANRGLEEYIKLQEYLKENQITLRFYLEHFGHRNKNSIELKKGFKKGSYKFKEIGGSILNAKDNYLKFVQRFTTLRGNRKSSFLQSSVWWRAGSKFFCHAEVDIEKFIERLNHKIQIVTPVSRVDNALAILLEIWNFRNQKRLRFEDL